MAIEGLRIIGESINDSVPSTNKLFEAGDIEGIKNLAKTQDELGATWIDVNVGTRGADFMAEMVREVQQVTAKPLSIDSPDFEYAKAGLEAYDQDRAGGLPPILNSIALTRMEMFDLLKVRPFKAMLLLSEREEDGGSKPNKTAEEAFASAQKLYGRAKECGLSPDDCVFDVGIGPIGSDTDGILKMVVGCIEKMHNDPRFAGTHKSVGLSNFTIGIPSKKADGSPVKGPLESAFITYTMPMGLDTIIGSVKRKYELVGDDHPAMQCFKDVLKLDGHDVVMRVMEYYM